MHSRKIIVGADFMDKDIAFNKEEFATLLDKAKGDRSINQYANETGVSSAHISRFLRQLLDAPPSPETISKLASKAYNEVSYRDLMAAVGHITVSEKILEDIDIKDQKPTHDREIIERSSPFERRRQFENLERKFFQIILSHLYSVDYKWNIQKPERRFFLPDMIIDIDYEGYKKWYLEFKVSMDERRGMGLPPFHVYGQIATMELEPTDKFTIAVNSEIHYKQFFLRPPKSLRANLYVMLVDLENGKIIVEDKLCDY